MDIVIDRDPVIHTIQRDSVLHPLVHPLVPDGPWIRAMRRVTGRPELFVFYHFLKDTYVLAYWTYKPRRYGIGPACAVELLTMSEPPDHSPHDLPSTSDVRRKSRPGWLVAKEIMASLKEQRREKKAAMVESSEQKQEAIKYLKRKDQPEVAASLQLGLEGYVGDREGRGELKELREDLTQRAKEVSNS